MATAGMCRRCKQRPASDGRTKCAPCLANAIRQQQAVRERAKRNRLCIRCYQKLPDESVRVTCPTCVAKHKRTHQRWARRLKQEVLARYGGAKCVCCGETGIAFLSIDHVHGDGAEHRRELGFSGSNFYRWLKQQGFPPGYQVLCMSCNWAKRRGGCCPHQLVPERAGEIQELVGTDWVI